MGLVKRITQGGRSVRKLIVSVLAITMILAVKTVVVQAGDKGPKFMHTEAVGQYTNGVGSFGPAGPTCDASTGDFSGCTFATSTFTGSGTDITSGKRFTFTGSFTLLFGPNGAFITPSGQVDTAGKPLGACAPTFSTSTATYSDGTLTTNTQGVACCASANPSTDCPMTDPFGPPNAGTSAGVITGGTGIFAGAIGGDSGSFSQNKESDPITFHDEGVIQLSGGSD
jgi:hypothetical protein